MKISIITVCLNSEKTIEQTIKSVIGQQDADFEYIIIDGKSKDRTLEIIERYRDNISIIISEPDHGIYDAMNKGIALATGDIIGIINSDDWYEPDVFGMVRKCFAESDAEVIYGRLNLIDANGESEVLIPGDIEKLRYEMEIPHPTVFVKKEIYKKYKTFQMKYKIAADYDLMLRLYVGGVKFRCLDKVMANFRLGGISDQKVEICAEETLRISLDYLPQAPLNKREYFRNIIMQKYKGVYFDRILESAPNVLFDVLSKRLGVGWEDNIAVFGSGNWGRKICDALLQRNIQPLFFVDNDKRRWNKIEKGIRILPPETLETFKGTVVLGVHGFSEEILGQIRKFCNPELYSITWEEFVIEYEHL